MEKEKMVTTTISILNLLVQQDYTTLVQLDLRKELDENYLQEVIEWYGGFSEKMTMPPLEQIEELLDIYDTRHENVKAIDFDLWFENEKSDLTLQFYLIENEDKEELDFALNDIHIL